MSYNVGEWIPIVQWRRLPKVSGIYVIRHSLTGKEYVGRSFDIYRRLGTHVRYDKSDKPLYRAIAKYGLINFEVCLLCVADSANLDTLEIAAITSRGTLTPKGYNLTLGGGGISGMICSAETKVKIGNANRGKSRVPAVGAYIPKTWQTLGLSLENAIKMPSRRLPKVSKPTVANGVDLRCGPKSEEFKDRLRELARVRPKKEALLWEAEALVPKVFESTKALASYLGAVESSVRSWCSGRRLPENGTAVSYAN